MTKEKEPTTEELEGGAVPKEKGPAPEKPTVQAEKGGGGMWREFRHAPPSEPPSEQMKRERGRFSWAGLSEMLRVERTERKEKEREEEISKFTRGFLDSIVAEVEIPYDADDTEAARLQIEEAEKRLTGIKRELEIKSSGVRVLESYLEECREVLLHEKPREE